MTRLEQLEQATAIQTSDGNWNYDTYMHGMANGMIFALAVMKGEAPDYLVAPTKWLSDQPVLPVADHIAGISAAMKSDPDLAWGWHCNIACLLMDENVPHEAANERAAGFMKLAFDASGYDPDDLLPEATNLERTADGVDWAAEETIKAPKLSIYPS